jgi:hypothetical protein
VVADALTSPEPARRTAEAALCSILVLAWMVVLHNGWMLNLSAGASWLLSAITVVLALAPRSARLARTWAHGPGLARSV